MTSARRTLSRAALTLVLVSGSSALAAGVAYGDVLGGSDPLPVPAPTLPVPLPVSTDPSPSPSPSPTSSPSPTASPTPTPTPTPTDTTASGGSSTSSDGTATTAGTTTSSGTTSAGTAASETTTSSGATSSAGTTSAASSDQPRMGIVEQPPRETAAAAAGASTVAASGPASSVAVTGPSVAAPATPLGLGAFAGVFDTRTFTDGELPTGASGLLDFPALPGLQSLSRPGLLALPGLAGPLADLAPVIAPNAVPGVAPTGPRTVSAAPVGNSVPTQPSSPVSMVLFTMAALAGAAAFARIRMGRRVVR